MVHDRGIASMVRVSFTENIQRHVLCPSLTVQGGSVHEALQAVFASNPQAMGYILDEQGALRRHMNVFVNGEPIRDRIALSDPVTDGAEVYVMQALSGG